jgi:excisionase family DNA binding protein
MSRRPPFRDSTIPRRGLSREEAAVYVGVSPSFFDDLVADGRLPKAAPIGSRKIWDLKKLDRAADTLFDVDGRNEWDEDAA